jgi:hypothetical protein
VLFPNNFTLYPPRQTGPTCSPPEPVAKRWQEISMGSLTMTLLFFALLSLGSLTTAQSSGMMASNNDFNHYGGYYFYIWLPFCLIFMLCCVCCVVVGMRGWPNRMGFREDASPMNTFPLSSKQGIREADMIQGVPVAIVVDSVPQSDKLGRFATRSANAYISDTLNYSGRVKRRENPVQDRVKAFQGLRDHWL